MMDTAIQLSTDVSPGGSMSAETIAEALDGKPDSNGWICHCPVHADRHPSLSVSEGKVMPLVHCFAGCSQEEVIAVLKAMGLWEGGSLSPQTALQPCNLENYSTKKGIPIDFLKGLGLSDFTYQGSPAIKIPYRDLNGEEVAANFRLFLDKGMGENVRFKWKSGTKKLLYGLWRLGKPDHVVLVEGESDCHTLWYHDIPAIGLPGAGCWNDSRDSEHFDGIQSIYVVIEPDQGGESVKKWVAKSAIKDRVKLVTLPNKDPSGLYVNDPGSFIKSFSNALEKAQPYLEYERLELDAEHKEAWEQCQELAKKKKILDHFIRDFGRLGVVGEDRAGKLIYLAVTSRFLSSPVSIVLKGPSRMLNHGNPAAFGFNI